MAASFIFANCIGCKENMPNQSAHMHFGGGCLSNEHDEHDEHKENSKEPKKTKPKATNTTKIETKLPPPPSQQTKRANVLHHH